MSKENVFIPLSEIEKQKNYAHLVSQILNIRLDHTPRAFVHTYGCQGNVADSERMKGQLKQMGYEFTQNPSDADLILFNTCAVREHAEDRVFGNIGQLKKLKEKNRELIIAVCGCMMQQEVVIERMKKSYPYVNLVFGTFAFHRLPENIYRVLSGGKRVFDVGSEDGKIAEGIDAERDSGARGWLPIMYGCDNFCSYCIVPYVRGRERSRRPENILTEAKKLIADGVKEITLLGQNVNSYGKGLLDENGEQLKYDFADLLRDINNLDGDFIIRFMTSHPKDCTKKLLDTMAECEKVCHHLHLPVQCGNNRVLKEMNRRYTRENYLELVKYAREKMPDISLTSDIIVGFPGETYEEFRDTVSLIEEVGFTSLFTFIYSKRTGTVAAKMDDPVSREEKGKWFDELCAAQEKIAAERTKTMVGKTYRVLAENGEKENQLQGRTDGNVTITFDGTPDTAGKFVLVKVTEAKTWVVFGEQVG